MDGLLVAMAIAQMPLRSFASRAFSTERVGLIGGRGGEAREKKAFHTLPRAMLRHAPRSIQTPSIDELT